MWVNGFRRAAVSIQPVSRLQRDEDRGQEQDEEDRGAYHGPGLLGAEQHRHPRPEEGRRDVGEDGQDYEAEEVEAAA